MRKNGPARSFVDVFVAGERNDQDVSLLTGGFKIFNMTRVQEIEYSVAQDYLFSLFTKLTAEHRQRFDTFDL
jgi:hypothetical protein